MTETKKVNNEYANQTAWSTAAAKMLRAMLRHLDQAMKKADAADSVPTWLDDYNGDGHKEVEVAMKKPAAEAACPWSSSPKKPTQRKTQAQANTSLDEDYDECMQAKYHALGLLASQSQFKDQNQK